MDCVNRLAYVFLANVSESILFISQGPTMLPVSTLSRCVLTWAIVRKYDVFLAWQVVVPHLSRHQGRRHRQNPRRLMKPCWWSQRVTCRWIGSANSSWKQISNLATIFSRPRRLSPSSTRTPCAPCAPTNESHITVRIVVMQRARRAGAHG